MSRHLAVQQSQADIGSYIADLEQALSAIDAIAGITKAQSEDPDYMYEQLQKVHLIAHNMYHCGELVSAAKPVRQSRPMRRVTSY